MQDGNGDPLTCAGYKVSLFQADPMTESERIYHDMTYNPDAAHKLVQGRAQYEKDVVDISSSPVVFSPQEINNSMGSTIAIKCVDANGDTSAIALVKLPITYGSTVPLSSTCTAPIGVALMERGSTTDIFNGQNRATLSECKSYILSVDTSAVAVDCLNMKVMEVRVVNAINDMQAYDLQLDPTSCSYEAGLTGAMNNNEPECTINGQLVTPCLTVTNDAGTPEFFTVDTSTGAPVCMRTGDGSTFENEKNRQNLNAYLMENN